ncbi:cell division protein ZipA C-terminal FtsZ-binding domain-containing protein [uncultured Thiothrix sp.]|uniref:cell division protein ZipA C-terminal FtsZ-binding domain-containing protein n=1 Tax=uncultured Thiothrix sp. TaxID=223185 RepID=UPI002639B58C|nr:cell division protein ZipA C-terminal FtsZ-binding domain-containing protein [uncultured Thiothrix sp.]
MEILSLIIMIIGLLALVFIYWASRRARQDLPKQSGKLPPITQITAEDGSEMSSVLADFPARDGKLPNENAPDMADVMKGSHRPIIMSSSDSTDAPTNHEIASDLPPQLIMFIAAEQDDFEGGAVLNALDNSGLQFGEKEVYHRMILTESGEKSLFYVANGIKPWTLIPEQIAEETTPGLSLILNLPSPINNREAIHDFVKTAERLNYELGGVIKNQNQEVISQEELRAYFAMI